MTKKHTSTIKNGSGCAEHADQPEHKEIDILVDRFLEYKSITKGFIAYYEGLAKLETSTAAELQKIGGHLPVPLREGNQFLAEGAGGWQTILFNTRERTRAISDHHTAFAQSITQSTLHDLNKIKADVKELIAELGAKPTQLATEVGKSRAESTEVITHLSKSIAQSKTNPMALVAHDDPVLLHRQVEEQVKQQMNLENSLTRMIIEYQKKGLELEKRVNIDIQAVVKDFESARLNAEKSISNEWQTIHAGVTGLNPELEWTEFAQRSGHLVPEDIEMRDLEKITFPGHNEELTSPINVGLLERKKRFTRNYKEGYYVLTPSGYLHEFKTSDPTKHSEPEMSIFLPNCTLGAPAPPEAKTFKWHIEGARRTSGGHNTGSLNKMKKSLHIGSKEVAFSFKSRTHAEMMHWWELMQKVAQHSVTLTDKTPDTGPQTVTHRAGTSHEEEAGGSSDEEGSALSPDDHSPGPITPHVISNSQPVVVTPTKQTLENLPEYKGDNRGLDVLKESPNPRPFGQDTKPLVPQ
ncbi:hypothetical protein, variant [Puccinia graminis f. sp. tritici CRL 75-36-700-3]|uniref:PH domain-containing protein n=1 Tax=Puccinia graminis f. sp. tritici (strain CRL 75-36-700-3 / race SCCL) TaxID=418459 RepID=E3JSS5_PUCGT|nr:uncharacterized protein PGTG_01693 [Puccinia graminis f. sp. tritici CRL 75-36-700-3]XP_003890726.1 hypothetical protein, variant [Puccinia graminis f. sp. tritici CRL 75-36-700-3]EFP75100.2 hypothetical protein PGTG_01693 [Puccinia graminis f. sp. tritici CRL 75-36-700-3]EHS63171.1 hypothetical protein, variant [Puccinia graminis f. sp. tritici CRL 75-36-700-3]